MFMSNSASFNPGNAYSSLRAPAVCPSSRKHSPPRRPCTHRRLVFCTEKQYSLMPVVGIRLRSTSWAVGT